MTSPLHALKHMTLLTLVAITLAGCGYSGPEKDEETSPGGTPPGGTPPGGTTPPREYGADIGDLELIEGSYQTEGNLVVPGGTPPSVKAHVKLRQALSDDATISLLLTCPACQDDMGAYPKQQDGVFVPKGLTEFEFDIVSDWDTAPGPNQQMQYSLDVNQGGRHSTLKATGTLTFLDDDYLTGNDELNADDRGHGSGAVVRWDLNGAGLADDGQHYTISQTIGPAVEFGRSGDELTMLFPGGDTDVVQDGQIRFHIKPERNPEYDIWYRLYNQHEGAGAAIVDDSPPVSSDGQYLLHGSKIAASGYVFRELVADDVAKLSWKILTRSPENRVEPDVAAGIYLDGDPLPDYVQHQFYVGIEQQLLLFDAASKTYRINPEYADKLRAAIDSDDAFQIQTQFHVYKDASATESELYNAEFNIRSHLKKVSLTIEGLSEEQLQSGRYRVVLRDLNGVNEPAFVKVVRGSQLVIDHVHSGTWAAEFVDLSGEYSGFATVIIYPNATEKSVILPVTLRRSASVAASSSKAGRNGAGRLPPTPAPACEAQPGGRWLLHTGAQDQEARCTADLTLTDLRGAGGRRQLVVDVISDEFPSFTQDSRNPFNDTWRFDLMSQDLPSVQPLAFGHSINVSHAEQKIISYTSACFSVAADAPGRPQATFNAWATNVGDDQLHTEIRVSVRECPVTLAVRSAKLENRGGEGAPEIANQGFTNARKLRFAHARPAHNDNAPLFSLPYRLNETARDNHRARFDVSLDLYYQNRSTRTPVVSLDQIQLLLNQVAVGDGHEAPATVTLASYPIPGTSNPTIDVTNITRPGPRRLAVIGKKLTITDITLPNLDDYQQWAVNRNLTLSATVTATIDGTEYTTPAKLLTVTDELAELNTRQLRPLFDIDALRIAVPQLAGRYIWDQRYQTGTEGREDVLGRDGWMLPELWRNLFVGGRPAFNGNLGCSLDRDGVLCSQALADNDSYLDELRVGDVSAVHARCFVQQVTVTDPNATPPTEESWPAPVDRKCRSILNHASHYQGVSMDVRYIDDNGAALQPPSVLNRPKSDGGYFDLWHDANNPAHTAAVRRAARVRLRNWVINTREWLDWLRADMAGTTTPLVKIFMGDDAQSPAHANYLGIAAPPTIKQFMQNGVLPGPDTEPDIGPTDDNPGPWTGIDTLLSAAPGHSDHIHLDFRFPQAGAQPPTHAKAGAQKAELRARRRLEQHRTRN